MSVPRAAALSTLLTMATALAATANSPQYIATPYGRMLSHCVREVPSGAMLEELSDGSTKVMAPDGSVSVFSKCDTRDGRWPLFITDDSSELLPADDTAVHGTQC